MESIVIKLLEKSDYKMVSKAQDGVTAYKSDEYGDVVIVASYAIQELVEFDAKTNIATTKVMDVFDEVCEVHPTALKDTSLIICFNCESKQEFDNAQNAILAVEENYFGFRKYVIPYTNDSIEGLLKIEDEGFIDDIYARLNRGFIEFSNSKFDDVKLTEYSVVMNTFVKLPFMKLLRDETVDSPKSLDDHMNAFLEKHSQVQQLVDQLSKSNSDNSGYELLAIMNSQDRDLDDEITDFLKMPIVQTFVQENNE